LRIAEIAVQHLQRKEQSIGRRITDGLARQREHAIRHIELLLGAVGSIQSRTTGLSVLVAPH